MEKSFRAYILCVVALAAVLIAGWQVNVFRGKAGCLPHDGVMPAGQWMDSCASADVGDLSRDATWYDLEPSIAPAVRKASVLIFGSSRMLYATSLGGATAWFGAQRVPFYDLAYEGDEQSGWALKILQKFRPAPKVVIFDISRYFTGGYSIPATAIFSGEAKERQNALGIQAFFRRVAPWCPRVKGLCDTQSDVYRSTADGTVTFHNGHFDSRATPLHAPPAGRAGDDGDYRMDNLDALARNADAVIAATGVPKSCVIFTMIPNEMTDDSLAKAMAARVGVVYIAPTVDGLATVDRSHLTTASSKLWLGAFLTQSDPVIRRCTGV